MVLAQVIGKIWATKKIKSLNSYKMLTVQEEQSGKIMTAIDTLDAGKGDRVVITRGSSAMKNEINYNLPIDATVIAIVDDKK